MANNQNLMYATDMLLSLAAKLPEKLMIHASEETFTIAFLQRLTDEQLSALNEAVNLHEVENVFLYVYTVSRINHKVYSDFTDLINFDFKKIHSIIFNEEKASMSIPNCYVPVALVVA